MHLRTASTKRIIELSSHEPNLPAFPIKKVQDYLMKGLPRHELEASIQAIFRGADGDGSGALDRAEFIRCLKESGLGFTRRELNLILSAFVRSLV